MTTTILLGTTKGAFLLDADDERAAWEVRGPFCDGWPINHVLGSTDGRRLWAAGGSDWHGAGVWRSEDGGDSWSLSKLANGEFDAWIANDPDMAQQFGLEPSPPAPFDGEITALWSLGRTDDCLYAGAKPATLFQSTDGGESWEKVSGLTDHPSRDSWQPGGAGLVLHTIVARADDPQKLWVGISAAGVFATEDGGETWDRRNRRSNEDAVDHAPHPGHAHDDGHEVGHCVHNVVRAATNGSGGDLLYQQNHHGVFRSLDGGRSWQDIAAGLPSTFGFPIAVHPHDPETIWVLPLNGDSIGRYPPDASASVWKSSDGGVRWTGHSEGLPVKNCFFTVLRQAMATDREAQPGLYFGTNSGSVFASVDGGERWSEIARHLPTVLSVETAVRA
ncbi:exo-alpha-sialidase [Sulfitobacter sp. D35]|uniref:WD40/YVTN/BNR-like repeat-containing protein n=1 Tax=Sulfitobacter sp. D35 TaxID=3083252 RepID=UPI00296ED923|nr:exo-alpha-sialidase [Sulfitobacter sp. D35]MDW4498556.1 exo-alpha-sialidase [Sulfitobacter sp. D35]